MKYALMLAGLVGFFHLSIAEAKPKKVTVGEARKTCLRKDSDLSGKALLACIKKAQKPKKPADHSSD